MSVYCEENHPFYLKFNIFLSIISEVYLSYKLRGILISVYVSVYDKSLFVYLCIYMSLTTPPVVTSLQSHW